MQEPACGSGPIYCLKAAQDVTLESRDSNFNNLSILSTAILTGDVQVAVLSVVPWVSISEYLKR